MVSDYGSSSADACSVSLRKVFLSACSLLVLDSLHCL